VADEDALLEPPVGAEVVEDEILFVPSEGDFEAAPSALSGIAVLSDVESIGPEVNCL
jgi:hypothetical protein